MDDDAQFQFWVRYLKATSIFFTFLGVLWAVIGSFDPFGLYDTEFAKAFWGQTTLPEDVARTKAFLLGPFGATSAGYFVFQYFIAKNAYAKRELWAYHSIVAAFVLWFVLDTTMSLIHGAGFNVLLANIPSLMMMGPVFFTRKYFESDST